MKVLCKTLTVRLDYFKASGKWYAEGWYKTRHVSLFQIWEDVEAMWKARCLPGLSRGHSLFTVLINVPRHEHAHPHILIGKADE